MIKGRYIMGDCMDYMPNYPDNYFNLAIVDPPTGQGESGGKKRPHRVRQYNGNVLRVPEKKYNQKDYEWDDKPPSQEYFDELFRISRFQVIWYENHFDFIQKSSSAGRIVWDKVNQGSDQGDCEIAWTNLFNTVRQIEYMWRGMMQGKSLKEGRVQQGDKSLNEIRIHSIQKPVLLYRWILNLPLVKKNWKILDTHVGSASSLIACEIEGMEYEGYEKHELIYAESNQRLINHCRQLTAFK